MNLGHLQAATVKWLNQGAWFTLGQPEARDWDSIKRGATWIKFPLRNENERTNRWMPEDLEQVSAEVKVELRGLRLAQAAEAHAVRKEKL